MTIDPDKLDWRKGDGLLPAIVQHWRDGRVLMQGWMNRDALAATLADGRVTFWSRSKGRLWMKGESSGHVLEAKAVHADCDGDCLLVFAEPHGPACHLGTASCFGDGAEPALACLGRLDALIAGRERARPAGSYTTRLFADGVRRIAQKVGEEAVETALAAVVEDDAALLGEAADLVFHLLVLLRARRLGLGELCGALVARHASSVGGADRAEGLHTEAVSSSAKR